ncbi:MAG: rane fusion protein copper/silver efflux system [Acidobacteriaceae bacterium]|nr:rane fusion protein copper/silver efflux system [Acidobacteriaceae bacterium]
MNKYILGTSLVWLVIIAVGTGVLLYRSGAFHHGSASATHGAMPESGQLRPEAAGPLPMDAKGPSKAPEHLMAEENMQAPLTPVQLTPERMQSIGVRTGTVEYEQVSNDIRATGNVDIDERLVSYVQVRFPGYIRKVFANATYQYVRAGEPLFTVYSPDLVATQKEFLLARHNEQTLGSSTVDGVASGAETLATAAEQRLQQWDVPQSELNKLKLSGKPIMDLTINSPVSGYITERTALPNMYVETSTRLYTIADLSHVWVYAQVFQGDVGQLKPGDASEITVDSYPGRIFAGRIEQVLPQVDMATRTVHVRLAIANPGLKLKPGMFVNVALKTSIGRVLVIPASAVLQSGTRQLVFLDQGGGNLRPQEVTLGRRVGDDFIVLKGLKEHQRVVTSANFLIDSESQLQAAAGSFTPPPPGAGATGAQTGGQNASQANIELSTDPNPPQRGNNVLRVKATDPSGKPVSGAEVTIKFYMAAMPAMNMAAMDITIKLPEKGGGLYEGSGKLDSGGTWQVTITVQKNGQTLAMEQLRVNATGGM